MITFFRTMIHNKWRWALALGLILSACAPVQALTCPVIKVGVILNGTDTAANDEQSQGYAQALEAVNAKGIGQGCKIQLIYPTGSQNPQTENYQEDVQDLVVQGAVAIIAPSSNDAAQLVANMAGYFNIPVIVPSDTGDEILPENNQWVFRITPPTSSYASAVMAMTKPAQSSQTGSVAIFYEHTDYGESAAVAVGNAALLNNMQISVYLGYSPFIQDYTDLQTALTGRTPTVVFIISTQTSQAAAIYKMVNTVLGGSASTPNSSYVIGNGSGFTDSSILYDSSGNLNSDLSGLILTLPWNGNASQLADSSCSQVEPPDSSLGSGSPLSLRAVQSAVSLNLLADALQKVTQIKSWTIGKTTVTDWKALLRSTDNLPTFRKSIADTLPGIQGCLFGDIVWPVRFNAGGQNQISPLLVKIQAGSLVTVYPQR